MTNLSDEIQQDAGEVRVQVVSIEKKLGDGTSNAKPDAFKEMGLYGPEGPGILEPPYSPNELIKLVEGSSILPQAVSAMAQNVVGFGHTLVADASLKPGEAGDYPKEVAAERERLEQFFTYGHYDAEWNTMARQFWKDLESTGNAYLEMLRDGAGDLSGWEKMDPSSMRLTMVDRELTEFTVKARKGTKYEEMTFRKRFRRFVQISDGRPAVWFKEFGDPRELSSATGKPFTVDELAKDIPPATEILHFRIYWPGTPYGVPRWVGNLPSVAGARAADEVNWLFFDNKTIPPLFILVNGGTLTDGSMQRVTDAIRGAKGRDKFHSAIVLETSAGPGALAVPNAKATTIDIKPMNVTSDGQFLEYDKAARAKVRSAFLLPPLFVGESDDYSHATAQASQEVADAQVFTPERQLWDELVNRHIMPALDARFWTYKTNSGKESDPMQLADLLVKFAQEGALTAGELRVEAQSILGKELQEIPKADWLDMPLKVWLQKAGAQAQADQAGGPAAPGGEPAGKVGKKAIRKSLAGVETVGELVAILVELRKELLLAEAAGELAN